MKTLFPWLFLLIAYNGFSQLQVKKAASKTTIGELGGSASFKAELYYNIYDKDTTYTLMYKNEKYKTLLDIKSLTFDAKGGTLNGLYDIIKSVFKPENMNQKEYKVDIILGETDVIISNLNIGTPRALFWTSRGIFLLNEKELDILFGKG